jgi:hypothetical protein
MMMAAEEPPRENVTARGQVRDDGRRRIARGDQASGGGILRVDIYYQDAGWSAWLWSRCGHTRRLLICCVCGRGASMRETSMGETVKAGTFDQGIFFPPCCCRLHT